ncbi:MAG: hypothetical protein AAFR05_13315 [Bacteroidota bacterium]
MSKTEENFNWNRYNRLELSQLRLGEPLPHWSLESIFGDAVPKPEDFLGRPLLLLFFSVGCPGCLGRAIPYANRTVYERGERMAVLGIHTNFEGHHFPLERLEAARENFHIRFPFYRDANYDTTLLNYGAGGTPHWVVADAAGKATYSIFGSDPNNALLRLDYVLHELLL